MDSVIEKVLPSLRWNICSVRSGEVAPADGRPAVFASPLALKSATYWSHALTQFGPEMTTTGIFASSFVGSRNLSDSLQVSP